MQSCPPRLPVCKVWSQRLVELDEKRLRAQDLAVDGLISRDELRERLDRIESERATAQRELANTATAAERLADLEGVMNFSWETVASWHGHSKTIPKRRFRRRVGLRSPLPGARSRGRSSAQPRAARGLQRSEVDCENRLCLTLHATRPSTLGSCIAADEEVALCWRLRGDGSRFARAFATFGEPSARSDDGDTRLSHSALHS